MILGFISLLLTFGQNYIAQICIPVRYGNTMLPCKLHAPVEDRDEAQAQVQAQGEHRRRLLSYHHIHRFLSSEGESTGCKPVRIASNQLYYYII